MDVFNVTYRYRDDLDSEFESLIAESNDCPQDFTEDEFLWFGLSEKDIIDYMEDSSNEEIPFIITSYEVI